MHSVPKSSVKSQSVTSFILPTWKLEDVMGELLKCSMPRSSRLILVELLASEIAQRYIALSPRAPSMSNSI